MASATSGWLEGVGLGSALLTKFNLPEIEFFFSITHCNLVPNHKLDSICKLDLFRAARITSGDYFLERVECFLIRAVLPLPGV